MRYLLPSLTNLFFRDMSLTEPRVYGLARLTGQESQFCILNTSIADTHYRTRFCTWVLGIQTQVSMLAQEAVHG